jgi:hypothetical protein
MKKVFILIMAIMVMLIAMPVMASACGGCLVTTAIDGALDVMPTASIIEPFAIGGGGDAAAPGGALVSKETSIYSDKYSAITLIDSGGGGCHAIASTRQSYMTIRTSGEYMILYARDVTIV